jgi:hypothetical protein
VRASRSQLRKYIFDIVRIFNIVFEPQRRIIDSLVPSRIVHSARRLRLERVMSSTSLYTSPTTAGVSLVLISFERSLRSVGTFC